MSDALDEQARRETAIACKDTEIDYLRREIERLREAGAGYSQQTVDALTRERDALKESTRELRELSRTLVSMLQDHQQTGDGCHVCWRIGKKLRAALEATE